MLILHWTIPERLIRYFWKRSCNSAGIWSISLWSSAGCVHTTADPAHSRPTLSFERWDASGTIRRQSRSLPDIRKAEIYMCSGIYLTYACIYQWCTSAGFSFPLWICRAERDYTYGPGYYLILTWCVSLGLYFVTMLVLKCCAPGKAWIRRLSLLVLGLFILAFALSNRFLSDRCFSFFNAWCQPEMVYWCSGNFSNWIDRKRK